MLTRLCFGLIVFLLPAVVVAQNAKKIPVAVSHRGDDQVGQNFAFALKEAIRKAQSFRFVDDEPFPTTPRLVVHLASIDSFAGEKGVASAIGITIVYDSATVAGGIFIGSTVLNCGRSRVESCAKDTLPDIDRSAEALRKIRPDLWKTL